MLEMVEMKALKPILVQVFLYVNPEWIQFCFWTNFEGGVYM